MNFYIIILNILQLDKDIYHLNYNQNIIFHWVKYLYMHTLLFLLIYLLLLLNNVHLFSLLTIIYLYHIFYFFYFIIYSAYESGYITIFFWYNI